MSQKIYFNEQLQKILDANIIYEKYGEFTPILSEIFQRRAYEFKFSNEHMKEEIERFCKKLDKIEFVEVIDDEKSTLGEYYRDDKRIAISRKIIDWLLEQSDTKKQVGVYLTIYEALTHEVYHVLEPEGFSLADYSEILNEIVIETAATRTSRNRTTKDNENFRMDTYGYDTLTFVANLLSTSFFVSEREFLRAGIQGRTKLEELVQSCCGAKNEVKKYSEYLDQLTANLESLYDTEKKIKDVPHNSGTIRDCLNNIYSNIYKIAITHIISVPNRKFTVEELTYAFQKSEKIIMNATIDFTTCKKISIEQANEIIENIETYRMTLMVSMMNANAAVDFDVLVNKNVQDKEFENACQWNNEEVVEKIKSIYSFSKMQNIKNVEKERE